MHFLKHTLTYSLTGLFLLYQDVTEEEVTRLLSDVKIPEYRPSEKVSFATELVLKLLS